MFLFCLSYQLLFFLLLYLLTSYFLWYRLRRNLVRQWLQGIAILVMIIAAGSLLCFIKNPLHQKGNYTNVYKTGDAIVATVNESLLSKPATYKANVAINGIYHNKTYLPASGTLIVYFDKKNLDTSLAYGSQIVFIRSPQQIINPNNPGAFNYGRFLLFQGITAQVYLKSNEYKIVADHKGSSVMAAILRLQVYILTTIKTFIPNQKEQGVAEALLIGYRNDLDNCNLCNHIAIPALYISLPLVVFISG